MGHEIAFLTSRFAVNKKHERQPMITRIQHKIKVLLQRSHKLSLKPFIIIVKIRTNTVGVVR